MSTSRNFGQFLVEKGQISADDLVRVLMSRIQSVPSVAEIVYRKQLLTSSELLAVLSLQSEKQLDFLAACSASGLFSDDLRKSVWTELERERVPLVSALVEEQLISLEQMNQMLDEYLRQSSVVTSLQSPADPISSSDSAPQMKEDCSSAISEFANQFSEVTRDFLLESFGKLEDPEVKVGCLEVLHRLAGSARFAKLSKLETTFEVMEFSVGELPFDAKVGKVLKEGLAAAWTLREVCLQRGTEVDFGALKPEDSEVLEHLSERISGASTTESAVGGE